jgi:type II secretory pathway predicted ATPase ExeA
VGPRTSASPAPPSASPSRPRPVRRQAHPEAIARISFCVVESALGVVTRDVGAGKNVVVRAAVAALDPARHQVTYIANLAWTACKPTPATDPGIA